MRSSAMPAETSAKPAMASHRALTPVAARLEPAMTDTPATELFAYMTYQFLSERVMLSQNAFAWTA